MKSTLTILCFIFCISSTYSQSGTIKVRRDSLTLVSIAPLKPKPTDNTRYVIISPLSTYTYYYSRGFSITPLQKTDFNRSNRKELYSGGYGLSAMFDNRFLKKRNKPSPYLLVSYISLHRRSINYYGDTSIPFKLTYKTDQFCAALAFPNEILKTDLLSIDPYLGYALSADKLTANENQTRQMRHMISYGCLLKCALNGNSMIIYMQIGLDKNHFGDIVFSIPFTLPVNRQQARG